MPISLKIKKQGGGITMHIGDPKDKRGVWTPRGQEKPKDIKIPKKRK